jgi:hypothetical protein
MMKLTIPILLAVALAVWYVKNRPSIDGFVDQVLRPPMTYPSAMAHGVAPAGVNASPGQPQYEQNANSPHVNPAYKNGNPQNVFAEYLKQP